MVGVLSVCADVIAILDLDLLLLVQLPQLQQPASRPHLPTHSVHAYARPVLLRETLLTMSTLLFSTFDVSRQTFYRARLAAAIVNLKPIVPGRLCQTSPDRVRPSSGFSHPSR